MAPSTERFAVPADPSPNLRTLLAYVAGLEAWDLARIIAPFGDSLEHHILPKSLGRPVLNKRQYTEYMAGVIPLFKSFKVSARPSSGDAPGMALMGLRSRGLLTGS